MKRVPNWLPGLLTVVATLAALGLLAVLMDRFGGVGILLALALLMLLFVGLTTYTRRTLGGRDQHKLMRQALATGEVPERADRERWSASLRGAEERWPTTRCFYVAIALLALAVNVNSALDTDLAVGWAVLLGIVAGAIAAAIFAGVPYRIALTGHRRAQALRPQLDG